jgi:NAD(P)H dehydrogenase (quinone)
MAKILIIYYSRSGNTKKMAQAIAEAVKKEKVQVELRNVQDVNPDDVFDFDGLIVGSPVYYGSMAAEIKEFFDKTVKFHGRLDGKVGAAFSSSANIGGGNETTILDILNAMLIHGMIIQGDPLGDHYGAVSIGSPDSRSQKQCTRLGQRTARLVKKITEA